jgi:hypothetical protein
VSVGALDMVNFGAIDTVPPQFRDARTLYRHNATVTLMRTTPEECAEIGRRIAAQLNRATGPTTLVLPLRGVSMIDAKGQPFHDPDADRALFDALRDGVGPNVRVLEVDAHINDPVSRRRSRTSCCARWRPRPRAGIIVVRFSTPRRRDVPDMPFIGYDECVRRLRAQVEAGRPIIGAGAGTGISAKFAERGGVDLIIIYNSGRYRMAGRGSLAGLMPYGDANAIVVDMAREVLPVVQDTPVLAGVCGTDPFRMMRVFLPQLKRHGLRRRAELPDGRPHRRPVPAAAGGDRHGLELEVEMIADGARARHADLPVRVR